MKKKGPYGSLKIFTKALILIGIIACVAPFWFKGPDDQPLLKPDDLKLPDIKSPKASDIAIPGVKSNQQPEKIYKWKDKNGVWHFSDKKDPSVEAEVILVTPDRIPQKVQDNPQPEKEDKKQTEDGSTTQLPFPMTISPAEVKKLKEDAERIKVELGKRYEEMAEQMGSSKE